MPRVRIPNVGVVNFPDTMSPQEIEAEAQKLSRPAQAEPAGSPAEPQGLVPALYNVAQAMGHAPPAEALPDIGGALAGAAAGALTLPAQITPAGLPIRTAAAGLGGAAGEAAQQFLTGQELSTPDIARAGGVQAAYEAGGGLLAKGVGRLARPLMQRALRPTATALARAGSTLEKAAVRLGQSGLPKDLVEAALEQQAKVGKVLHLGSQKALALRRAAAAETEKLYKAATASGTRYDVKDLITSTHLLDIYREARLAGDEPAMKAIQKLTQDFADIHGKGPITPVVLKRIVQVMQGRAEPVLRAVARGESITGRQATRARVASALARTGRQLLDQIPGVAEREVTTQRRILVEQAVRRAENLPPTQPRAGVFRNLGYEISSAGGLLDSAALASRLALFANNPILAQFLQQTPRAVGAGVEQAAQP